MSEPWRYDYIVEPKWDGDEGAEFMQPPDDITIFRSTTFRVYSTIQAALDHAKNVSWPDNPPQFWIAPGFYDEQLTP